MPRIARVVAPGLPHHVTQRGNNRQDVFFADDDRRAYLKVLGEECQRHGVAIVAYCLMTNHVHLVLVPPRTEALALALGRTHWRYAQDLNRLHGRSGHVWQNRFYSAAMDGEYALQGILYVERNPVRAGLARLPWRYRWSSAAARVGEREPELNLAADWLRRWRRGEWRQMLSSPQEEATELQVRRSLRTGRPLAGDALLAKLEARLGRRLRVLPVGRPRLAADPKRRRRGQRSRGERAARK